MAPAICVLALLLFQLVAGLSLLHAQEGAVVRSISFEGNGTLGDDVLGGVIMTYETGWFAEKIFGTDPYIFSEEVFRADLHSLIAEYQREGFLRVRIDTAIVRTDEDGGTVTIVIRISEEDAFTVESISVEAPGDSLWSATFREVWPSVAEEFALRPGFRFRDADVLSDREQITVAFSSRGYAYVQAQYSFAVDTVRGCVGFAWTITPGPLCRYGDIGIAGNMRVETSLIEGKLEFKKGDIYSNSQLEEVQREIYALGQFQAVLFRPRLGVDQDPSIPLTIVIQEASQTKAKFGGGYGAEEHFRGFVELKRLGFLGGARTLTLYAKYSSLTPLNASITFTQPDFLFPSLSLFVRPFILFEKEIGYSANRYGGDITVERRLFRSLFTSLSYTLEQVRTPAEESPTGDGPSTYNKSALGLSLTLNSSAPLFDPVEGWLNALRLFYSGLPPSPEVKFFRALYDTRRYDLLGAKIVLATRVKIGSIWSLAESGFVPPEERFYAGGSYSVRGYSRNRLGPADETGNPTGGQSLLEGSIEFRFPLAGSFGLVTFVDAGNVWDATLTYKLDEVAYAAGAGLRYDTPVGPVRFDAARSLTDRGMPWEFHFSIGQAF